MDELTPICQMKDLPLGGSTTCRRESLEPRSRVDRLVVCCCLPSETCGSNRVTQIFSYFHRAASSTTVDWSRWIILNVLFISFLTLRSHFLDLKDAILFLQCLLCYVCTFPLFCKYTLHVRYVFNVNSTDSFDDRRSQFRLI